MPRANGISACALLFLSGAAALGYQIVWTRVFATGIGHEAPAMLAIVCAFMAGNAAGAWLLDKRIADSRAPLRWYAALEFVIGGWAALSVALLPLANSAAIRLIGLDANPLRHWLIAFFAPSLTLLPATFAMGATFPAMERVLAGLLPNGRGVGAVYASNTFGAVIGAVGGTWLAAPHLGFSRTILLFAGVNIACGTFALLLKPPACNHPGHLSDAPSAPALSKRRALATLFATGLAGIGFEAAGTRVLSQILENTIFTFSAVLAVYLLGTALGAALYQRFCRKAGSEAVSALAAATGLACATGIFGLSRAPSLYARVAGAAGSGERVVAGELCVAAAVFGFATIAMGALFSHLAQTFRRARGTIGIAVAVNTLGGALAPAVFGLALFPLLGSKWTLLACCGIYFSIIPRFTRSAAACGILFLGTLVFLPSNLHVVTVPQGGRIVAFREGVMAAVAVVEDARGDRVLRVNNRFQMGGTSAADAEYRGAHIPILLHPNPRSALFLGLGTGITMGGALAYPDLRVDGVELVPEAVELLPLFAPHNRAPYLELRARLFATDARRFVRTATNHYDVIVADLFHPARDGAGALYTREHFLAMRDRLAPGGLVCQWLPLHQLDEETLAIIVRTFRSAFPFTDGFLLRFNVDIPVLGLIGMTRAPEYTDHLVESRLESETTRGELKRLALADTLRLLGHHISLEQIASTGPLNTDDLPLVTFRAPAAARESAEEKHARLLELARRPVPFPCGKELKAPADYCVRLNAYLEARNAYLRGLVADAEERREEAIDLYLESARISEDFTSGYAQCLTTASLLSKSQPQKSRALLEALIQAQPSRPVARQMLERMQQAE